MPERYHFEFSWDGAFGHCVTLVENNCEKGLIIDIGAGYGAIAEPLAERGFEYLATDIDQSSLDEIKSRGFETYLLDLENYSDLSDEIVKIASGRKVSAITGLDVIEHLRNPTLTLSSIKDALLLIKCPILVLSIPNVAHVDLGLKLIGGRWDITQTGLLDSTHVSLFTKKRVESTLSALGFELIEKNDVIIADSEQSEAGSNPLFTRSTSISQSLRLIRNISDRFGDTYQFVRAFRLGSDISKTENRSADDADVAFVLHGDFDHLAVQDLSGDLDAYGGDFKCEIAFLATQDLEDFVENYEGKEMLIPLRKSESDPAWAGFISTLLRESTGKRLVFLTKSERIKDDFFDNFRDFSTYNPDKVLFGLKESLSTATGDLLTSYFGPEIDMAKVDLMMLLTLENWDIFWFAIPRDLLESLAIYEVAEDIDQLVMLSISFLGLVFAPGANLIESENERSQSNLSPPGGLNLPDTPLLMPNGWQESIVRLRGQIEESRELRIDPTLTMSNSEYFQQIIEGLNGEIEVAKSRQEATNIHVANLENQIKAIEASTSWKLTAPLRKAADRFNKS
ncbi:MAG: methyltransferase domain-containing protein [Acidimicrobiales bacterium]|nr:methyltransferase domain-containing protein [Acidimicrobiales bacterium]